MHAQFQVCANRRLRTAGETGKPVPTFFRRQPNSHGIFRLPAVPGYEPCRWLRIKLDMAAVAAEATATRRSQEKLPARMMLQ